MAALRALRHDLEGRVIVPGDPGYDEARAVYRGGVDRRPSAIVRAAGAADVARVIAFARESGSELAVRSGGHSIAGHSATEGGLVLDLGDMRAIEIDQRSRTAWAETGLTTGAYTELAATHGLATGFGDTGSVGIGGITLGGGVGFLSRKHGLTIDDLLAAEVVTADGRVLRADPESHPDLFWAIRGGGGNFGVATRLQFRLHVRPEIVGGVLVLPASPDVIAGFVAAAEDAPDELTTIANVMPAPPLPFLPEDQHGRLVVFAMVAYAGIGPGAQAALEPFRALAEPLADMIRPMRYADLFPPDEEGPQPISAMRTMFVDRLERPAAATIVDDLRASTANMAVVQIRVLGGAIARVPNEATAYAHRDRRLMVNVAAMFERPEEADVHAGWVAALAAGLDDGRPGAYANFLGDEGTGRVREAYPGATWDRLAEIKARYDPDNLFRLNQNIPPARRDAALAVG